MFRVRWGWPSPAPLRKKQEESRSRSFWSRPLLKGNCFPKRPPPEDWEVFCAPAIADFLSDLHENVLIIDGDEAL